MLAAKKPYAVVIGGTNVDIAGRAYAPLVARDSNPGRVCISLGGVGRNIAHNLSLLGVDVHLLTVLGDDLYAAQIADSCRALQIDLADALCIPGASTSTYLSIGGCNGDMALAVSDMGISECMTPAYIAEKLPLLQGAAVVAADTNLPAETLRYLAQNCPCSLFVDPVSTSKAEKLRGLLGSIYALKPNRLEAEKLSGIPIRDEASLRRAAAALLKTGLQQVYISLGADGVLAADHSHMALIPCCKAQVRNTTGAGDAFMAALVQSHLAGRSLEESARFAAAAAAIATEGAETINPALSTASVRARLSAENESGGDR